MYRSTVLVIVALAAVSPFSFAGKNFERYFNKFAYQPNNKLARQMAIQQARRQHKLALKVDKATRDENNTMPNQNANAEVLLPLMAQIIYVANN